MNFNNKRRLSNARDDKPMDKKYVFKKLATYIFEYKWLFILAILLTISSNLLGLVSPKLSGSAIDSIIGINDVDFENIKYYLSLMLICTIGSVLLSYLLNVVMVLTTQKIVKKMRHDLFTKLLNLPISYYDTHQAGDIISRMSYDIDTINTSLSSDVVMMLSSSITVIGSLVMMLIIAPILVLVFVVTIPLSLFVTKFFTSRARKYYIKRSHKLGDMNGFVEERLSGARSIQAYCREDEMIEQFDKYNAEASDASYLADYYGAPVGPSVNFVNNISLALISMFGGILYLYRAQTGMTIGKISSFVLYSRKFSGPINEVANIVNDLQSAYAAAERVFQVLDSLEETKDNANAYDISNATGDVEAKNISFGYVKDKIILKNVSFSASAGSTIAIVGPTGAGKTTIINLLMRFYELNDGAIYLDGKNIRECMLASLRSNYAMVLQETWLFTGTIYENLMYGSKTATKEDVHRVCKRAHIDKFIESLPDGYNTVITEEGINISKGQKQLLTIARAMLLDCHMLILDEATSNVDTKTELEIQASMLELMKDKTCFVIAHRLSTIQNADLILVVKNGNIIEQGNHKELLENKGFYYDLFNSQF